MKNNLTYSFPEVIYLFIIIPIILLLFFQLNRYRDKQKKNFGDSAFFKKVHYERSPSIFWRKTLYLAISTCLVIFALMDPKGNGRHLEEIKQDLRKPKRSVYLFLDTSKSMIVNDIRSKKSRLQFAKEIADELISQLNGENVSLYTFTSETNQQTPLTLDYLFSRLVLRSIESNHEGVGGTDFLKLTKKIIEKSKEHPDTTIFIFSDGGDLEYEIGSDAIKEQRKSEIIQSLVSNDNRNLQIFTIGLGTENGGEVPEARYNDLSVNSKLIPDILQLLSKETNGIYYFANPYGAKNLASELAIKLKDPLPTNSYNDIEKIQNLIFDHYYQKPIAIAILLLAAFIAAPENWKKDSKK